MTQSYVLHGRLDSAAAPSLTSDLLTRRGAPICLDAGAVDFAGALSVQVLISAHKQWGVDGESFRVAPISAPLAAACGALGVALDDIGGAVGDVASGAVTDEGATV